MRDTPVLTIVITRAHLVIVIAALCLTVFAVWRITAPVAAYQQTQQATQQATRRCDEAWRKYQQAYSEAQARQAVAKAQGKVSLSLEPSKPKGC